jgi:hypothetical protein
MNEIISTPNGLRCRLRSDVENKQADKDKFSRGDICFAEEDWSLWCVTVDFIWKEMV